MRGRTDGSDATIQGARYRSKDVEVIAIRWTGENAEELEEFTLVRRTFEHDAEAEVSCFQYEPLTQAGCIWNESSLTWNQVDVGDYIIRGTEGAYYSCDPSAFHEVYEPAQGGC
jgi:hypothetical protein